MHFHFWPRFAPKAYGKPATLITYSLVIGYTVFTGNYGVINILACSCIIERSIRWWKSALAMDHIWINLWTVLQTKHVTCLACSVAPRSVVLRFDPDVMDWWDLTIYVPIHAGCYLSRGTSTLFFYLKRRSFRTDIGIAYQSARNDRQNHWSWLTEINNSDLKLPLITHYYCLEWTTFGLQ